MVATPVTVVQVKPLGQLELAVMTWPFVPTANSMGVEGPEAVMIDPLAVSAEQEIAVFVDQARPPVQAELAVSI
jgi:hypothetical protein